ncbi:MAG: Gfo/Idh/MocA family oxidoreductase, partial [Actinomycetota bacterium]|nr:Gfo/Idh/MocA family oxidoreductase [Actinomycetota bacterium]
MSAPLRMAVIGVGRMGRIHARILSALDEIDLVAVVDSRTEVVDALGTELDATPYTSADALVSDDSAAAWLLATSTPTHPSLVRSGLNAGLDILCEKPLSLELSEGAELGDLANRIGRVLQVGFWR